MKRVLGWSLAAVVAVGVSAGPAMAEPEFLKKVKDAGLPAQNCQYCHTDKVPKKETFKPDELNERGKWLLAEAEKRKAKKPDPVWVKQYPGGAEQK